MAGGELKGLARGVCHRLIEAGGVMDRRAVDADLKALSQHERRALRMLGVRIGAFSLFLPGMLRPDAIAHAAALSDRPDWHPPLSILSALPQPAPSQKALAARGLRAVGGRLVPVEQLERLDALLRAAPKADGGVVLSDQAREALGWSEADAAAVLRGLDFAPTRKAADGALAAWRRRAVKAVETPAPAPHSPFAALAALKAAPPRKRRPRRRKVRGA